MYLKEKLDGTKVSTKSVLSESVILFGNKILAGSTLTEEQVATIKKYNLERLIIELTLDGEFLLYEEGQGSVKYFGDAQIAIDKIYTLAKKIIGDLQSSSKKDIKSIIEETSKIDLSSGLDDVSKIVNGAINKISSSEEDFGVVIGLDSLKHQSENTHIHSINVGFNAMKIGRVLSFSHEECIELGIGGFAHDIGKALTPNIILNKEVKFENDEWSVMKMHSPLSYFALRYNDKFNKIAALVAGQHHEYGNGKGYGISSGGIDGFDEDIIPKKDRIIHPFSNILMIADMYTAISESRSYHGPKSLPSVLMIMNQSAKDGDISMEYYKKFYESITSNINSFFKRGDVFELSKIYTNSIGLTKKGVEYSEQYYGIVNSSDSKTGGSLKVFSKKNHTKSLKINGKSLFDFDFKKELIL